MFESFLRFAKALEAPLKVDTLNSLSSSSVDSEEVLKQHDSGVSFVFQQLLIFLSNRFHKHQLTLLKLMRKIPVQSEIWKKYKIFFECP